MKAQSLACRASSSRAARSRAARGAAARGGRDGAQLGASRREHQLRHLRRVPGGQVLRPAPARQLERALERGDQVERRRQRGQLETRLGSRFEHRRQQGRPLVPPVTDQLGVERAATSPGRPRSARGRPAADHARHEVASRARARAPAPPRGRRARRRCSTASGRATCGGGSRGRCDGPGSRAVAPDQLDRLPVDRHRHRPRLGGHRRELVERAKPERIGLVHAEGSARRARPARARGPARRRTRAARSRRPSSPKRRTCEAVPAPSCSRRPASVASSGSSAWVAARSTAPRRSSGGRRRSGPGRGARTSPRRACSRPPRGAPRRPASARPPRSSPSASSAWTAVRISRRKRSEALARLAAHGLELVAQHRVSGRASRARRRAARAAAGNAGHRLPQPLLAERPGAEALDVGHVASGARAPARPRCRVSDAHASAAPPRSPAPGRAGRGAQREVARRDRGHEAVVEGLRDAERGVHAVPAGSQRQLVRPQLAGVEDAEQLDRAEAALAERPELLGPVLAAGARGCPIARRPAARA